MIYNELSSYFRAKHEYDNMQFRIVNGVGEVYVNGRWRNANEVPAPRYEHHNVNHIDKTHIQSGIISCKSSRGKRYSKPELI